MNWIEFRQVCLGYGRQVILADLTFALPVGQAVGLAGPNGSGKTTILKAVLGLLEPLSGTVIRDADRVSSMGYVPQRGAIDDVFPFTLREIVEMGFYGKIPPWQGLSTAQAAAVGKTLSAVGLEELADKPFRELSGGQKQRGLLARALVAEPRILVLDEPTHGLDMAQARTLLTLLDELRRQQQLSMIIVSHNLVELLDHSQSVLLLHLGRLAFSGPTAQMSDEVLEKIYQMPVRLRASDTPLQYQDCP